MEQYTWHNHYQYGWDGQWFNKPGPERKGFQVAFGQISKPVGNFREECVNVARLIGETAKRPIVLALSGGIDSEVVARSFLEAKVSFKAVTVRFPNKINLKDVECARAFCQQHRIEHSFIDLDILEFWGKPLFSYAKKYGITSTHRPLMMYLIEKIDGHVVFGTGDIRLRRLEGQDTIYFSQSADSTSIHRILIELGVDGCPRFFNHTPEIMKAFLEDPHVVSWVKCARAMRMLRIKDFKPFIFHRLWPEMPLRQKLHGYELLEPLDMKLRQELNELAKYNPKTDEIRISYNELLDSLTSKVDTVFKAGREL